MADGLPAGARVTYARQYRRCGKPGCAACRAGGPGHGPYWYAFWDEGGRRRSRYLGKRDPQPAPESRAFPGTAPPLQRESTPAPLRIRTLGAFQVWRGEEPLPAAAWRRRKAASLLKCLLSAEGHRLHRDEALELIWPEWAPAAAAGNLDYTVHLLRRLLDGPGAARSHVRRQGDVLLLLPDVVGSPVEDWLDADTFERCAEAALAGRSLHACQAALALYGGDYLPDDRYADWATPRRQALRSIYQAVLLRAAALSKEQGDVQQAIRSLQAVLEADRAHEPAARLLMELLASEGRLQESMAIYRTLRAALLEDLGVAPSAETIGLHVRITAHPGNLPVPLTSFIGRHEERATLRRLLGSTRLLTLTGAGGSGKTRLALALAEALRRTYGHGAWLVELASLADAALVPQRVAASLGVRQQAEQPIMETLSSYLRDKELLLVLDNCEHLVDASATLAATLLGAAPGLRILATSWEVLGVAGETVWRVPSLTLPPYAPGAPGRTGARRQPAQATAADDMAVAAMIEQSEAMQLFVARARACRQDFVLRPDTAAVVARICWQLDGLPLAIELAAARVSLLPVEGIADRLDDHLRLLTDGPRTVLPRHQTLRAVMDWGHDLLAEPERALFRRLAVFAGGWTLGAAEAICAGGVIEEREEVLRLLGALVNKSLVVREEQGPDGRYWLLETVRQYAWKQLTTSAEDAAMRDRHLDWCAALAEEAEPALRGLEQAGWLARLDNELDNLRAALAWSRQCDGRAAQGERLASRLWRFWLARGYLGEGRAWLGSFLASAATVPIAVRAGSLAAAGRLAYYQSDYAQATERYEACLALCQAHDDLPGMAAAYNGLGLVLVEQGHYEQAAALFERGLALHRGLGDTWATAGTLNNLGLVAHRQGDYGSTAARLEESLALYRRVGDQHGMANTLNTWGVAAMDAGDLDRAAPLLEESLALHRELNSKHGAAIALSNLGMLARQAGEHARALTLLREGLTIFRDLEAVGEIGMCLEALALVAGAQGEHEREVWLFGAADSQREALGAPLTAADRAVHDAAVATAREAVGAATFARTWTAGHDASPRQVVAEALAETSA